MTSDPVSLDPEERAARESEGVPSVAALRAGSPSGRRSLRWALPLAVIAIGAAIFLLLLLTRAEPVTRERVVPSPLVRVTTVQPQDLRLSVRTRGTVAPRTESDLVAEVRGRVVWLSPKLVVGGFFEAGDELLRLDNREYRISRDRARATVVLRESEARLADADAERQRQLQRRGAASASDLEQFETRQRVATASLSEARAALEQAELDYERTVALAPYDGRVRERNVDVGQFVSPGTKLGRIFAVDYAEVRLPIQTDDLAFLDVALDGPGISDVEGAKVRLTGRLGGREFAWPARLDRAESAIDAETRMLYVVARVDDPYAIEVSRRGRDASGDAAGVFAGVEVFAGGSAEESRAPLPAGLFVEAEIDGRALSDVFVLPLMALRDGGRVFVFDDAPDAEGDSMIEEGQGAPDEQGLGREGRLQVRVVNVVRRDRDHVVIDAGLSPGDRVVISPLRVYTEDMRLRMVEASDS